MVTHASEYPAELATHGWAGPEDQIGYWYVTPDHLSEQLSADYIHMVRLYGKLTLTVARVPEMNDWLHFRQSPNQKIRSVAGVKTGSLISIEELIRKGHVRGERRNAQLFKQYAELIDVYDKNAAS